MGWRVNDHTSAEQVGAIIRSEREKRELTGTKLAQLAQVSASTLSQLEHGKRAVSLDLADQVLAALGLRLHVGVEPLHDKIDKAIAQCAGRSLSEIVGTWKVSLTAFATFLDGVPYIIEGPAAAALQGVPVAVDTLGIAIPADDDAAREKFESAMYRIRARRGPDGWQPLSLRAPGSPRFWTMWWGAVEVRQATKFNPVMWIDIDPLPRLVATTTIPGAEFDLIDVSTQTEMEPLKRARVAVAPLASIESRDPAMRRLLERTRERLEAHHQVHD